MKITYDGGKIFPELEDTINKAVGEMGFKFYASGMSMETGVRDLCYDKPDNENS